MARGKIQIKKIENSTNRQVTYSKRRNGLFKKAHDLTVLCDAEVSLTMVSCTDKVHEYISPSITTKRIFDQYQQTVEEGIDSHADQDNPAINARDISNKITIYPAIKGDKSGRRSDHIQLSQEKN